MQTIQIFAALLVLSSEIQVHGANRGGGVIYIIFFIFIYEKYELPKLQNATLDCMHNRH